MTPLFIAGLVGSVLVTAFLSGIFGMAGGLILMGILAAVLPVGAAMILHGVTQMASNGWRCWVWREHIQLDVLRGYLISALSCVALFTAVHFTPDKAIVFIFLGLLPFIPYVLPPKLMPDVSKPLGPYVCGFLVTALQLTAGVSGAMLDVFYVRSPLTRHQVVATKAFTQTIGHFLKLIYFGTLVDMGGDVFLPWWIYAVCIVTAMTGTTLAKGVLHRMDDKQFRRWSQWVLNGIGLVYLAKAATMLVR
ncbi:MAG: TSUP family transporter [Proteobacteria bacterium]|nr:TSUP family transporter [Pseudomonadota bacterium]